VIPFLMLRNLHVSSAAKEEATPGVMSERSGEGYRQPCPHAFRKLALLFESTARSVQKYKQASSRSIPMIKI